MVVLCRRVLSLAGGWLILQRLGGDPSCSMLWGAGMSEVSADTESTSAGLGISLPKSCGAISGLGKKFSPDLFTGNWNFSRLIAVPPVQNGVAPQLDLTYSTSNGNRPFDLPVGP